MPDRARRTRRERDGGRGRERERPRERVRDRIDDDGGDGDLLTQIRSLITGSGGNERAIARVNEAVMADNARYRQRHREDLELIAELEEDLDALPEAGSIVIPKALAEKLKITKPEDLEKLATDLASAQQQLTQQQLASVFEDAARALGWNSTVLRNLPGIGDGRVEMREETITEDGERKKIRVPYFVPAKAGAAAEKLEDYAKRDDWQPFMPALTAAAEDDGDDAGDTSTRSTSTATDAGTRYPRQTVRTAPQKKSGDKAVDAAVERYEKRAAAGNPLRTPAAPAAKT